MYKRQRRSSFGGLTSKSTAALPATADIEPTPDPERRESGVVAQPAAAKTLKPALEKQSADLAMPRTSPAIPRATPPPRPRSYFGHGSIPDRRLEPTPQSIVQAQAGYRQSSSAARARQAAEPRYIRPITTVTRPRRYYSHDSIPRLQSVQGKAPAPLTDKGKGKAPVKPIPKKWTRAPSPMVSTSDAGGSNEGSTPSASVAGGSNEGSTPDTSVAGGEVRRELESADTTPWASSTRVDEQSKKADGCAEELQPVQA